MTDSKHPSEAESSREQFLKWYAYMAPAEDRECRQLEYEMAWAAWQSSRSALPQGQPPVWMIERKANGPIPPMWWTGGKAFGVQRDCWTDDAQHGVKFLTAIDATAAHIALMSLSNIKTENMREKHIERVTITEHLFVAPPALPQLEAEPPKHTTTAPFKNCKYHICDLPGQCEREGKCHHPIGGRDSPAPRSASMEEIEELLNDLEGRIGAWYRVEPRETTRPIDEARTILLEAIQALAGDAGRYRWLRQCNAIRSDRTTYVVHNTYHEGKLLGTETISLIDLDSVIDAATQDREGA